MLGGAGDFRPDERRVISRTIACHNRPWQPPRHCGHCRKRGDNERKRSGQVGGRGALEPPRATFDSGFGHSIVTADERAAWDRIFGLISGGRSGLDALDVGCGTGFLSFELAARGHHVTGIDFAAAMLNEARRKTALTNVSVWFEQGDAENLPFTARVFDLVVCRHVLWTLPHPEAAVAEWVRVLRPGGRLVVLDSQFDENVLISPNQNARASSEYAGSNASCRFSVAARRRTSKSLRGQWPRRDWPRPARRPGRGALPSHGGRGTATAAPPSLRRLGERARPASRVKTMRRFVGWREVS